MDHSWERFGKKLSLACSITLFSSHRYFHPHNYIICMSFQKIGPIANICFNVVLMHGWI